MRLRGAPDVSGEQKFLSLARPQFPGMNEPFDAADPHGDHGVAEFRIAAGDDQVAGPGQHQSAGDAFAMDFGDGRFCQIAPAPGNLQVNFLLARKTAMGIGLGEPAPISNRWKINTGRVLAGGPQSWPAEKCGPLPARMMTLTASSCTALSTAALRS